MTHQAPCSVVACFGFIFRTDDVWTPCAYIMIPICRGLVGQLKSLTSFVVNIVSLLIVKFVTRKKGRTKIEASSIYVIQILNFVTVLQNKLSRNFKLVKQCAC